MSLTFSTYWYCQFYPTRPLAVTVHSWLLVNLSLWWRPTWNPLSSSAVEVHLQKLAQAFEITAATLGLHKNCFDYLLVDIIFDGRWRADAAKVCKVYSLHKVSRRRSHGSYYGPHVMTEQSNKPVHDGHMSNTFLTSLSPLSILTLFLVIGLFWSFQVSPFNWCAMSDS